MLRNTASMQEAWQDRMAARSARSSWIRQGVSSTQVAHPSRQGRHASRGPPSAGTALPATPGDGAGGR